MTSLSKIKIKVLDAGVALAKAAVLVRVGKRASSNILEDWSRSLTDPTAFYKACFVHFHRIAPHFLREHRAYFSQCGRGFGEEAFHTMWWLLFERHGFSRFLEIGVYRGQTLSLAALLQRHAAVPVDVTGISPFAAVGDSVSVYGEEVDYYEDTLANFRHFQLPEPQLVRALSTSTAADNLIRTGNWDAIYIDGNHDYPVAKADWSAAAAGVRPGGFVVLDDASLYTHFTPPLFATKGHPGPSQVADSIPNSSFEEVLRVGHNRVFRRRSAEEEDSHCGL